MHETLRSKIIIDFRIARRIISPFILFRSSINKLFTVDPCLFKKGEKFTCIDLNNHHSARNSTIISQRFAIHLSRTLSPIENALSFSRKEKKDRQEITRKFKGEISRIHNKTPFSHLQVSRRQGFNRGAKKKEERKDGGKVFADE